MRADFLEAHRAGLTPNPDVLCNREIKFGDCLNHALRLGAERLATGHYARLIPGPGGMELHKALDTEKDQSYFLHAVARERFAAALMPLGGLRKPEVRELAREAGLPVADKRDSTGICFVGERPFREFLARYIGHTPGPVRTVGGEQIGTHVGLPFYTLGQRGGIGVGGKAGGSGEPWYVVGKDTAHNVLVVAQGEDHPALFSTRLTVRQPNWLCSPSELEGGGITVRLRYRQQDQPAQLAQLPDGDICIIPASPQRAVTPGQSAVIYRASRCLGGGVIIRTGL
ncbi:MAG TPA: tRNA 2-thiouridine(34) synthase MnmA [Steroidobacteraceae bacterium]|nr:tRNA 2-thiouridine(34) synthase MnmA [Steroidobacteraceae bacterium]